MGLIHSQNNSHEFGLEKKALKSEEENEILPRTRPHAWKKWACGTNHITILSSISPDRAAEAGDVVAGQDAFRLEVTITGKLLGT